jgi:hypothetical protein
MYYINQRASHNKLLKKDKSVLTRELQRIDLRT